MQSTESNIMIENKEEIEHLLEKHAPNFKLGASDYDWFKTQIDAIVGDTVRELAYKRAKEAYEQHKATRQKEKAAKKAAAKAAKADKKAAKGKEGKKEPDTHEPASKTATPETKHSKSV